MPASCGLLIFVYFYHYRTKGEHAKCHAASIVREACYLPTANSYQSQQEDLIEMKLWSVRIQGAIMDYIVTTLIPSCVF